ncbi:putative chy and ring finger domain [Phaeomoniella chlamydospora]|uniref:Putative chy and ring finger domain n=1 Tax=Phaeomoniella chlamydospora TaxID=158046 RepID=A0A0G2HGR7_PHACM|nr:putative chy and ring finger domain [Phaeomoniella chlamydospora]
MPEEYRDAKALVNCNDCLTKSVVSFHWLGLKCDNCEGYNTTQLEFIGGAGLNNEALPSESPALTPQADSAGEALASAMAHRAAALAGTQRPSTAISDVAAPAGSPWLVPHRPGPRSASPVISNYFGLQRRDEPGHSSRPTGEPEEELEFWGGQSPQSVDSFFFLRRNRSQSEDSDDDDESMGEEEEEEEFEDDDPEDEISIFGHR